MQFTVRMVIAQILSIESQRLIMDLSNNMQFMKIKGLLLSTLLLHVNCQTPTKFITQNLSQAIAFVVVVVLLTIISLFIFYDRRQGYAYLTAARQIVVRKWNAARNKMKQLREKKVQKLSGDEQPSSCKDTVGVGLFESQKTYIEADIGSIQSTSNSNSSLPDQFKTMSFEEGPPVNLKQVFQKDKKPREGNSRSRSKLRTRVQIKKSQLEAEAAENAQNADNSQNVSPNEASGQLERSVDNSEV